MPPHVHHRRTDVPIWPDEHCSEQYRSSRQHSESSHFISANTRRKRKRNRSINWWMKAVKAHPSPLIMEMALTLYHIIINYNIDNSFTRSTCVLSLSLSLLIQNKTKANDLNKKKIWIQTHIRFSFVSIFLCPGEASGHMTYLRSILYPLSSIVYDSTHQ